MLKKPQNIYMPIDKFQAKVFKNKDTMSRGQWVENFALSLAGESEDDFANELITDAQVSMYKEKLRKWKSYTKNNLINENAGAVPTEKEIIDRCCEIFGDEFIEACDLVDSNKKKRRNNAAQEEGSNGFSNQKTGVNSSKGLESAKSPASTRSTGGKVASVPPVPKSPSEPEVLNLAYSGEFANVMLTHDQYNELLQQVGNMKTCNGMIDDFSASLADGSTTSANHFATLKKWAKARKRFDEEKAEPNTNVMTFQEREGKRQADQLRKYGLIK